MAQWFVEPRIVEVFLALHRVADVVPLPSMLVLVGGPIRLSTLSFFARKFWEGGKVRMVPSLPKFVKLACLVRAAS